ncbi:MAG TPA: MauE/DoxX family redox-associated membrane protein, partial [Gammaproteobacteria bacterium]|nr:MauE/DoxX family redox-associated membrane protein [Gammaproteobacteria bacterium]
MDAALDAAAALLFRASALAIGIVLLAAAFHKLRDFAAFRASIEGYRLLPGAQVVVVAALMPVLEALAGVALIVDGLRVAGAWLAFA